MDRKRRQVIEPSAKAPDGNTARCETFLGLVDATVAGPDGGAGSTGATGSPGADGKPRRLVGRCGEGIQGKTH